MPPIFYANANLKINLHPAAQTAYEWLENYPLLVDWQSLPVTLTNAMQREPLRGVMEYQISTTNRGTKKIPSRFLFFAPLWPARHWLNNELPEGVMLIDDETMHDKKEQIEAAAWISVLQLFIHSVDVKSISSLRENFQEWLPPKLANELFNKKKVTDNDIKIWTGISRGTLIQQRQRNPCNRIDAKVGTGNFAKSLAQNWTPYDD